MQNKLQELTDRLYKEGLSKGQEQAEQLLEAAKKEAAQLIEAAKETAAQCIAEAKKTAEETKTNAEGEIQLAARQTIAKVKQTIENIVTTKVVATPAKIAVSDTEFLKSIIKQTIDHFNPQHTNVTLSVLLPEDAQKDLQSFVEEQVGKQLSGGLEFYFDKTFNTGFKIGPKDGSYHISFTDKDFENLFGASLRPHLRALLFGN